MILITLKKIHKPIVDNKGQCARMTSSSTSVQIRLGNETRHSGTNISNPESSRNSLSYCRGIAVNIHGYQRMTADLDLIIQLEDSNIKNALKILATLGYKPTLPVAAEQFANANTRQSWIETKNMQVFSMVSSLHPNSD